MSETNKTYRIMISGGGTGGHIYPAISIAQALQESLSSVEILFVGAEGKMEMQKVPEAGFDIVGLWISGIQRKITIQNLLFPIKLISSIVKSFKLLKTFNPDVVVGVGGYASGPLLYAATRKRIPTLIQEQNSYAGLTNKWLANKVDKICVAHDGMETYFPKDKLVVTGNPVRKGIVLSSEHVADAYAGFGLKADKKTILVIGGSLGARTINESVLAGLGRIAESDIQLIWQTGGFYHDEMLSRAGDYDQGLIQIRDFVREMDQAYAVADVVISRAGALSIAELMLTGKPSVLVPSPNVAEDHQSKNALALVSRDAAIMVKDKDSQEELIDTTLRLLDDDQQQEDLSKKIKSMAHPKAAMDIANQIIALVA